MNIYRLYIAMFRALECLNEEKKSEDLTAYLQDADPYIFKDRHSAIPDVKEDFVNKIDINTDYNNPDSMYESVVKYLSSNSNFSDRFKEISLEEWKNLLEIIDYECNNENVF